MLANGPLQWGSFISYIGEMKVERDRHRYIIHCRVTEVLSQLSPFPRKLPRPVYVMGTSGTYTEQTIEYNKAFCMKKRKID